MGKRAQQLTNEYLRGLCLAKTSRYIEAQHDPFQLVDRPQHKAEPLGDLTEKQLDALMEAIYGTAQLRSRTLLLLLVTTGLRISEACGLQWQNVDLDAEEPALHARNQFSEQRTSAPLKTAESRRTVLILPRLRDHLTDLKATTKSEWVFVTAKSGKPHDRNSARSKIIEPMLERAGLPILGHNPPRSLRNLRPPSFWLTDR